MNKSDVEIMRDEEGIALPQDTEQEYKVRKFLVDNCSFITTLVYLVIAVLLVIAIVLATIESVQMLITVVINDVTDPVVGSFINLNEAVSSILFIIVLATLIDLVRSYLKYGRVLVRPILVAGITTMVRRLLVWDSMTFAEMLGIGIIILIMTFAIVFIGREDRRVAKFTGFQEASDPKFHSILARKRKNKSEESED